MASVIPLAKPPPGRATALGCTEESDSVAGSGVVGLASASSGLNFESTGRRPAPRASGASSLGRATSPGFVGMGTDTPRRARSGCGRQRPDSYRRGQHHRRADGRPATSLWTTTRSRPTITGSGFALPPMPTAATSGSAPTTHRGFQLAVNGTAAKPGGGSWSTLSDARLKKNVRALTVLAGPSCSNCGVTFEYIDPACINELSGVRTGMIAQEVEKVFPDWVDQGPDGMRRVAFRGFEALTVEALRDLRTETSAAEKATRTRS